MDKRYRCIYMLLAVLSLAAFSSCSVSTGAIPPREDDPLYDPPPLPSEEPVPGSAESWAADAYPGYACPADQITLRWNYEEAGGCTDSSDCNTMTATDSVGLMSTAFTTRQAIGSQVVGSIRDNIGVDSWSGINPEFTFSLTLDDPLLPGIENRQSVVNIAQNPPEEPVAGNFNIPAVCGARSGQWNLGRYLLNMESETFLEATRGFGGCVRITCISYMPDPADPGVRRPNPIVVTFIDDDSGAGPFTLTMGDTQCGLNLKTDISIEVRPEVIPEPRLEGRCRLEEGDIDGTDPGVLTAQPYTQLLLTFGCDTTMDECGN